MASCYSVDIGANTKLPCYHAGGAAARDDWWALQADMEKLGVTLEETMDCAVPLDEAQLGCLRKAGRAQPLGEDGYGLAVPTKVGAAISQKTPCTIPARLSPRSRIRYMIVAYTLHDYGVYATLVWRIRYVTMAYTPCAVCVPSSFTWWTLRDA